jgi:hypothetical protein
MDNMNQLSTAKRAQVVNALCEGVSIRATCRMTGVAKGTVLKLLVDLGAAVEQYQDVTLRNLKLKRIQCDELWSFVYAKQRNIPEKLAGQPGIGDAMEAGVSTHVWSVEEIIGLLDWAAANPRPAGDSN